MEESQIKAIIAGLTAQLNRVEDALPNVRVPHGEWAIAEVRALTEEVGRALTGGGGPAAAISPALTAEVAAGLAPRVTTYLLARIGSGWVPKQGWRTPQARNAHLKNFSVNVHLSDPEYAYLRTIIGASGLPISDLIRNGIATAVYRPGEVGLRRVEYADDPTRSVAVRLSLALREGMDWRRGSLPRAGWIRQAIMSVPPEALTAPWAVDEPLP